MGLSAVSFPSRCTIVAACVCVGGGSPTDIELPAGPFVLPVTRRRLIKWPTIVAWVAEQQGCYPHLVASVYAAVRGSVRRCQPAWTPTHTLLAYLHLNICCPQTSPLPLTEEHTAARVQACSIHLITQGGKVGLTPTVHPHLKKKAL